ncbi:hypothetical protein [Streptomyces sp. NRRL B-1347]|uniref:hypothetical protein n=1 Tax=Streptomyces sp. NRRL B-1347 TaxID=1476877 RepID=UPI0004C5FBE3|nr:hypothetical protein [Streptomyces sp. NRRL B-1347]
MPDEGPGPDRYGDLVLSVFAHVTGTDAPLGLETRPDDTDEWTSLTQVRLVHALEQRLGCEVDERFLTVGEPLRALADEARAATADPVRDGVRP